MTDLSDETKISLNVDKTRPVSPDEQAGDTLQGSMSLQHIHKRPPSIRETFSMENTKSFRCLVQVAWERFTELNTYICEENLR
jgi:hypothetical protein